MFLAFFGRGRDIIQQKQQKRYWTFRFDFFFPRLLFINIIHSSSSFSSSGCSIVFRLWSIKWTSGKEIETAVWRVSMHVARWVIWHFHQLFNSILIHILVETCVQRVRWWLVDSITDSAIACWVFLILYCFTRYDYLIFFFSVPFCFLFSCTISSINFLRWPRLPFSHYFYRR